MRALFVFFIISSFCITIQAQDNTLRLMESTTVSVIIDGELDDQEWMDAKELTLKEETPNEVAVLLKYDKENLYVAFKNLTDSNNINHNAEVLISTSIEDPNWGDQSYWFHSSYSNCSAVGLYYYWEDCTAQPVGWAANTFPFTDGHDNIEFKISFLKLGINPSAGMHIKMAFKISNPLEQHTYWPGQALIADPLTWGTVAF
ncbi:DOMON domain-containing protein [Aestuariivivens marinum]|uniref:hypothetical protein n=1 Tax=Aestuariivivens marinum TaxID=2913555 RepID=UPI001F55DD8B|nr:hypothetical protein [Aestuariivivens marinum]